jgi:hypothetical protein
MNTARLETDDNFVQCPRQGEIHVEYCMGCPRRISVEQTGDRTVVICEPGDEQGGPLWEPLRTPPAPFRLYED